LRPLLHRRYVGFHQESALFQRWIEPPRATVTLIVDFEEPLRAGSERLPQAWLGGLSDTYELVELGKSHTSLDLKLTPLGAFTLLGVPLRQLAGAAVGLDDLFGAQGRDLTGRLREASSWEERFDLLEAFLLKRAAGGPEVSPAVSWAWSRLRSTAGRVPIGKLATDLQMSRRHLTSLFHEQIGLPPKTVARLLRFTRVCGLIQERPISWVEIAHDCGYFDQSHLNRDFRDFAGTTPTDFLARQIPAGGVIGDGISIVQDRATEAT
jgi:AraC-like DNA-binding protein